MNTTNTLYTVLAIVVLCFIASYLLAPTTDDIPYTVLDDSSIESHITKSYLDNGNLIIDIYNPNCEIVKVKPATIEHHVTAGMDSVKIFNYTDQYFEVIVGNASDVYTFGSLTKTWDVKNKAVTIKSNSMPSMTVRLISSEPDLCTFTEIFEVTNFKAFTPHKDKDFKARTVKHKGKKDVTKVEWFIEQNISYVVNVTDYNVVQVDSEIYNNRTGRNETIQINKTVIAGYHDDTRYKNVWQKYNHHGKPVSKDTVQRIKVVYHKKPELGGVRIQTIPLFRGVECDELTWWNTSWSKKVQLNVNNSSVALTDYQLMKSITYDSDMNANFSDLRFVNDSNTGAVPYWIESKTDSSTADVWLKIPSISTTTGAKVWMYYGNSDVSSASSISDTFMKGFNFNSDTLDPDLTFVASGMGGDSYSLTATTDKIQIVGTRTTTHQQHTFVRTAFPSETDFIQEIEMTADWGLNYKKSGLYVGAGVSGTSDVNIVGEVMHESSESPHTSIWQEYRNPYDNRVVATRIKFTEPSYPATILMRFKKVGTLYTAEAVVDGTTYTGSGQTYTGNIDYIGFTANNDNNINTFTADFDNYRIRKHTATEPTWGTDGAEEDAFSITSYAPSTPLNKLESESQYFNITTNETCQCRWYINGTLKQTNTTQQTDHNYTNASLEIGYFNFSAVVNTSSGLTDMQTWWVTVDPTTTYIPPFPVLSNTTGGDFWANFTWTPGSGNITDSYNVSYNDVWDNGTTTTYRNESVSSGGWHNITVCAWNSSGVGTLSDTCVEDNIEAPSYKPPEPINLANTTGNFWVNHTWQADSGNVTDYWNVSVNDVWYNRSYPWYNETYSAHDWQNISVWAWNNTAQGTMSD